MVGELAGIAALCIVSAVLCKIFERYGKEYSLFIAIAAAVGVLAAALMMLSPIMSAIERLFIRTGMNEGYLSLLFKALGIGYITSFACDICRDSGENSLSSMIELVGKLSLVILSLPLFTEIADIVTVLVN